MDFRFKILDLYVLFYDLEFRFYILHFRYFLLVQKLFHLNPAITPNPKLEETKAPNNQKPIVISTTHTSSVISLSQLSSKFITAKNEAGYPSKTINSYYDTH